MSFSDVAIVNFNTRELLRSCLQTVFNEKPNRVIVVDNASSDGSPAMVKADFSTVLLLENEKNPGFSTAANQAIASSAARYVLLLNSDTRVSPGALAALEEYLDRNADVAIAGPRLLYPDGTLQRSTFPLPTPLEVFLDASNLSKLANAVPALRENYLRTWAHNRVRRVPSVLGAALAIRREAFDQVGGFDPTFYMYYEEVDLCYRLVRKGWKIHFTPVASIVHIGGASTQQRQTEMTVQLYAGLAHFYRRNYSPGRMMELIALVKSIALARMVRDKISLYFVRDDQRRIHLDRNIAAWQRLLSTGWERQAA